MFKFILQPVCKQFYFAYRFFQVVAGYVSKLLQVLIRLQQPAIKFIKFFGAFSHHIFQFFNKNSSVIYIRTRTNPLLNGAV